jgi:Tfp pilus assembly PilM family ATPase
VGLTGRDLMVKYVSSPPVPPWKLQMMMDLEIRGTSGADVCGDFAKLDIPGELTRETVNMVAVGRTTYVEHQMALAAEAGLGAEWACPNAVGLFNAYMASAQFRPKETVAVLDLGRDNMDLVIQSDGVLYFARSASGGARRFTDAIDAVLDVGYEKAERYKCGRAAILTGGKAGADPGQARISAALCEAADATASALISALKFCQAQIKISKLDLDRVVLSGGGSRLQGLPAYLSKKMGLPVEVLDPASRMDVSGLPAEQQALFEGGSSAEMSVAIGLAMAAADSRLFRLEVIPDGVLARRRFWRGTVWALAAAVVLAGGVAWRIGDASGDLKRAQEVRRRLTAALDGDPETKQPGLRKALTKYQAELEANDLLARKARLLARPVQRNVPVLGFVKLLRAVTPEGIVLSKLSAVPAADEQVEVTVEGTANPQVLPGGEYKALDEYRRKLQAESSKLAFRIDEPKIVTSDTADSSGRGFTLTARIRTLGLESQEEPGEVEPGQEPVQPPDGPVIVPRGLPSKPVPVLPREPSGEPAPEKKPPATPPPATPPGDDGNAFDGGGRP